VLEAISRKPRSRFAITRGFFAASNPGKDDAVELAEEFDVD
jgi:hypothetical protein